jgi:putative hemolysin
MSDLVIEIIIVLLLILANGVFALSELAILSARKARLQQQAKDGDKGAKAALELAQEPNRFLSTVQIGITLIGILTGAFGGTTIAGEIAALLNEIQWLAPYSEAIGLSVVVVLITYFSLVLGELVPKRIGLSKAEIVATAVSPLMNTLSRLATPLVRLLSASTEIVLRILRIRPSQSPSVTEARRLMTRAPAVFRRGGIVERVSPGDRKVARS